MLSKTICIILFGIKFSLAAPELKLVHVLISQAKEYSFPTYLKVGNLIEEDIAMNETVPDEITKEEKMMTYKTGVRLRERYASFLGDIYRPGETRVYTTDAHASRMSGILVTAGVWPAVKTQRWSNGSSWQPIPYDYIPHEEDILLMGRLCPAFLTATEDVRKRTEILLLERNYRDLFTLISEETGLGISNSRDVAYFYNNLAGRARRNLTLPSWTNGIFPNGTMLNVTYIEDFVLSKTILQMKLNGGFLLQKIIDDFGTILKGGETEWKKMIAYCADSELLVGVMHALGIWYPHIPNVASALIFEFYYDNVSSTNEIKILYDTGRNNLTIPLTVPGCKLARNTTSCRLDEFVKSLAKILPGKVDDKVLCGRSLPITTYQEEMKPFKVSTGSASKLTFVAFLISYSLLFNCVL